MRSFYEIAKSTGTDKVTKHNYHLRYPMFFEHRREEPLKIFEMGIAGGKSVKLWQEYFPNCKFTGLDIEPRFKYKNTDNMFIYVGDQRNERLLIDIVKTRGPFDIIIDDAGHRMKPQQIAFQTLFHILKDDGIYVIEDTQTSYMGKFKGGYKHAHSTIELLKQCIDRIHVSSVDGLAEQIPEDIMDSTTISLIDGIFFFEEIIFLTRKPSKNIDPFGSTALPLNFQDDSH